MKPNHQPTTEMSFYSTDDGEAAAALLATVRHLMTGREIDLCENIIEGSDDEVFTSGVFDDPDFNDEPEDDYRPSDGATDEQTFTSLKIQFHAQITNHIDSKGGVCAHE